ncbi:cupin domain-containing protein [Paraburkholderia sp. UCT31]|uniref:hypothetical protein n=1 Tax=Paraburkholderia sp. UCT31 TaxID=2615209 RepID=UPI0016551E9C|nr:hypothetical protein [Paraburkholderia sp. UCT31]MBC8737225.1 cupin domain-containing protein [Paraburkholderia sp. UCT31]
MGDALVRQIGRLAPDTSLLVRALGARFELNSFENGVEPPTAFVGFLREAGYEIDNREPCLLFASLHGVGMHTDEQLTALWTLAAPVSDDGNIELVVGGEYQRLRAGEVLLFDASKPHGAIAGVPGLWCVLSVYVKPVEK